MTRTLETLKPDQCKWPVTKDKPYRFCGKATHGIYCAEHTRMAHAPKKGRVRS